MSLLHTRRLALVAAASLALLSGLVSAQSTGGPSKSEAMPLTAHAPEKQAIDACVGKAENERVRFVTAKGKKRHWTCTTVDGVLAARPGVATPAHRVKKQ
ncbi:MAG: hypothetical protein KGL99_19095 [Burkholderiales bacterium]|nr:hypothetical protein [Burkholderiales bacterium]MDE2298285.1 hypothetical protein [Burkholderiales bacterium]MDE2629256.1 hypothetical protein [Burkholderiales bacterium]